MSNQNEIDQVSHTHTRAHTHEHAYMHTCIHAYTHIYGWVGGRHRGGGKEGTSREGR